MIDEEIVVSRADPRSDISVRLSEQSWTELNELYADIDRTEFFALDFTDPGSAFVLAHRRGQAVGCGAIRQFSPGVGEIKRIFVEPQCRGLSIGQKILATLEMIASDFGYKALRLETGLRQPTAIRLYERAGYERIPNYGRYRDDPLSVCFGKVLTIGRH